MTHRSTTLSPGAMDTHDSQPSTSSSLDILIGYNLDSSEALEATPERLQASKKNSEAHTIARNRAADPREWLLETRARIP